MRKTSAPLFAALLLAGLGFARGETPVIVNQAADGIVNYLFQKLKPSLGKGATEEQVLAGLRQMVDQYQGTGVSHLFWNVNYQRTAYASQVWPSYWDVADPGQRVTEWPRGYFELHKLGIDDVFALLIPRSRERGISPWISLRMNDHHYTNDPTRVSPLFFEHPELRTRGGTGLFNYARPEVREHYLKLVREVLERYDVDGIELDWIRTPDNFETKDQDAGRGILTEFVRLVRQETRGASARRGHPVRLAARVPATPQLAHGKGFEAVAWARQGLVDMIIPSDWWSGYSDIPVEDWRAQLDSAGQACQIVPATASTYACTAKGVQMLRNLAGMRGFAASMLDRGAGGIYLFNHFEPVASSLPSRAPDGKRIKEGTLADLFRAAAGLEQATRLPRLHALTIHDCLPAKSDYRPSLPATVSPGEPLTRSIHLGPAPAAGSCLIRVGLDQATDLAAAQIHVNLNGVAGGPPTDLPPPPDPDPRPEQPRLHVAEAAPRVIQFTAPLAAVQRGYNQVEVSVARGGRLTVIWLELRLEP